MAVCGVCDVVTDAGRENKAGRKDGRRERKRRRKTGCGKEAQAKCLPRIFKQALQPELRMTRISPGLSSPRADACSLLLLHSLGDPDGLASLTESIARSIWVLGLVSWQKFGITDKTMSFQKCLTSIYGTRIPQLTKHLSEALTSSKLKLVTASGQIRGSCDQRLWKDESLCQFSRNGKTKLRMHADTIASSHDAPTRRVRYQVVSGRKASRFCSHSQAWRGRRVGSGIRWLHLEMDTRVTQNDKAPGSRGPAPVPGLTPPCSLFQATKAEVIPTRSQPALTGA